MLTTPPTDTVIVRVETVHATGHRPHGAWVRAERKAPGFVWLPARGGRRHPLQKTDRAYGRSASV